MLDTISVPMMTIPYELKVICAISLISVPVGPHGSLLVAGKGQSMLQ